MVECLEDSSACVRRANGLPADEARARQDTSSAQKASTLMAKSCRTCRGQPWRDTHALPGGNEVTRVAPRQSSCYSCCMLDPDPGKVNAAAVAQTLRSFARSLNDDTSAEPATQIRLAFDAVADMLASSSTADSEAHVSVEAGLAVLNVMSAGMDRLFELSEIDQVEVPSRY